jgi:glycine/D-amino acid oxidase-like deaminating enzyme
MATEGGATHGGVQWRVDVMDRELTESLSHWQASWPASDAHTELLNEWPADSTCDVCVIGGGLAGISAALHCAESAMTCVVLEANELGAGASARNGGILWPAQDDDFEVAVACELHSRFACAFDDGTPRGGVHLQIKDDSPEHSSSQSADLQELLTTSGVDVSSTHLPASSFHPNVDCVSGARLVHAIAAAARDSSLATPARVCERAPVASWRASSGGSGVAVQVCDGRVLRCSSVVVATNAWTPRLLPHLSGAMRPCTNSVLASARPAPLALRPRFASAAHGEGAEEVYFSFTGDGYVVVGGLRALTPGAALGRDPMRNRVPRAATTATSVSGSPLALPPMADSDEADYAASDARTHTALRAAYARLFPALSAACPLERTWVGVMCSTVDRLPLLGRVDSKDPRVWICGGFNGHGMPRAFGAARAVVRAMLLSLGDLQSPPNKMPVVRSAGAASYWAASEAAEEARLAAWNAQRFTQLEAHLEEPEPVPHRMGQPE